MGKVGEVSVSDTGAAPAQTYGNTAFSFVGNRVADSLLVDGSASAKIVRVQLVNNQAGVGLVCDGNHWADIARDPSNSRNAILTCTSNLAPVF